MNALKRFFLGFFLLIKQAFMFPKTIADAVKQRREQSVRNGFELERLDRIRNPSKYLGK